MSVKLLVEKEINDGFAELQGLEKGSEEYEKKLNSIGKLLDKLSDMEKNENDYLEKSAKLEQMAEDKKDHFIKNCLTGFSIISGIALTVWGTNKSLKFEETGTVTTMAGRAFIQKLFPKK